MFEVVCAHLIYVIYDRWRNKCTMVPVKHGSKSGLEAVHCHIGKGRDISERRGGEAGKREEERTNVTGEKGR